MDRGAWWAAGHGLAKSRTQLSDFTFFLSIIWNIVGLLEILNFVMIQNGFYFLLSVLVYVRKGDCARALIVYCQEVVSHTYTSGSCRSAAKSCRTL